MVKSKNSAVRVTYSVRLNPELLKQLKHVAVDENKTVGELIEEGITAILQKRKKQTK
jgi:hypothetical protein